MTKGPGAQGFIAHVGPLPRLEHRLQKARAPHGKHFWLRRPLLSQPAEVPTRRPCVATWFSERFSRPTGPPTCRWEYRVPPHCSCLLKDTQGHGGHLAGEVKVCPFPLKRQRSVVLRAVCFHAPHCTSHLWEASPHHCLSVHTADGLSSAIPGLCVGGYPALVAHQCCPKHSAPGSQIGHQSL